MGAVVILVASMSGCVTSKRPFGPLSGPSVELAEIPGFPEPVRFWGDSHPEALAAMAVAATRREEAYLKRRGHTGGLPPAAMLALSGGGENGAYGAGLLCGWTEHGNRPDFKLVTGISTGALIAPMAFLGSEQDANLKRFYTSVTLKDIAKPRGKLDVLWKDAAADTGPLASLIEQIVDDAFLRRIAEEYEKGRLLFIGTTYIDAERPVLWDMGAIARRGGPEAAALFRKVMLASASIPAAFPPQYIAVESGGKRFDEMHVDGGATAQVFVYPASLDLQQFGSEHGLTRERRLYVIRNGLLGATWYPVNPRALPIATRSISALIRTQGVGDLYRIYLGALRDGLEFNLAVIEDDLPFPPKSAPFDSVYMTNLFNLGYERGKVGYPWMKSPPGFDVEDITRQR